MIAKKPFYITTTLPYVNSDPHIGFAMEIVRADVVARYKALMGYDVFFNTGTDEHGVKIYENAIQAGKTPQAYTDEYAEKFRQLKDLLNLSAEIHFIRTTDEHHIRAAQEFWKVVFDNGYIYKKQYQTKYCVGCELEKTDSELENGKCPIHPNRDIEFIDEENYFFKFSAFEQPLLDYYEAHSSFVFPASRLNEMKSFVSRGLQDFSISRLKEKMPWGVPVPDDESQVMYVWFDALVNYISTLGWPGDEQTFSRFWENGHTVQYAGKDNLRQQSAMWQAMLMAANLAPTDTIVINGFINSAGQKMSKSLGNVINPIEVVKHVGIDGLRFYVVHDISPFEDSDVTLEKIRDSYNGNLANGIGNLLQRVMTMASKYEVEVELPEKNSILNDKELVDESYHEAFKILELNRGLQYLMKEVRDMDEFIAKEEPFKKIKINEGEAKEDVARLVLNLWCVAILLEPYMPETATKIQGYISNRQVPEQPLFARID